MTDKILARKEYIPKGFHLISDELSARLFGLASSINQDSEHCLVYKDQLEAIVKAAELDKARTS